MAPSFEDKEIEQLATEIAKLTGESESDALRQALRERRDRLLDVQAGGGGRRPRTMEEMLHFMETEIWSQIPDEILDKPPMTKAEKEELLGYGPEGY